MGFLSGIFSQKRTTRNIYRDNEQVEPSDEKLSGVSKYIKAQIDKPIRESSYSKKLSGVAEFIKTRNLALIELTSAEKSEVNARISATIEQRKAEEILMSIENEKLSGVAKYVESQEQALKSAQEKEAEITGVTKYITNIVKNKPVVTGVSRYLFNRVDATVSSVDRYVINKALADKNKPEVVIAPPPSSVTKYLENRPTMKTSSVAKYIAKQIVATK